MYMIRRWKNTKFWSLTLDGELIALIVYKKGAHAVLEHLMERDRLKEKFCGLRLIQDMVADKPKRFDSRKPT